MTPDPRSVSITNTMIGKDAFCPRSGATLSRERHFDGNGRPWRAVQPDESAVVSGNVGELTTGAVRSSRSALVNHFERCHERHAEPDERLYVRASLAFKRLKASAEGRQDWDVHVWYALKRRLDRMGYDVGWMDAHAQLRCPNCHAALRFELAESGEVVAQCGVDCLARPVEDLTELREVIASLYRAAFDEDDPPDPERFLEF